MTDEHDFQKQLGPYMMSLDTKQLDYYLAGVRDTIERNQRIADLVTLALHVIHDARRLGCFGS